MIEYCAPIGFWRKNGPKNAVFMGRALHKASIFEQGGAYNNLVWIFIKNFFTPPKLNKESIVCEESHYSDFGCFIAFGRNANRFIKHPSEVLKVGDIVKVWVLAVDIPKKRISLTMKQPKN